MRRRSPCTQLRPPATAPASCSSVPFEKGLHPSLPTAWPTGCMVRFPLSNNGLAVSAVLTGRALKDARLPHLLNLCKVV